MHSVRIHSETDATGKPRLIQLLRSHDLHADVNLRFVDRITFFRI